MSPPRPDQPFVDGSVATSVGPVPRVGSNLSWADRFGSWKARWGIGRMHYTVDPGLYALNSPDRDSPVVVTANYKMSFDRLRKSLPALNAWLLVLDTDGINVWCAAGKGTFGTEELINRIEGAQLAEVISHRQLILPQLAGPGVAAHEVTKRTRFRVAYGPIQAVDLPAFIERGFTATREMRTKSFTLGDRAVLIPFELVSACKIALPVLAALFLISLAVSGLSWPQTIRYTRLALHILASSILAGAVCTPLFLPWLPGRAFSLKGFLAGLVTVWAVLGLSGGLYRLGSLELLTWMFSVPPLSAYLAMNFTGCSTYTSLSGVRKEMRWSLPLEIAGTAISLIFWLSAVVTGR